MKVLMPDEVKERNIITKSELQAIVKALNVAMDRPRHTLPSRSQLKAMETALPKICRTLAGMA
jgi:hypothetical protein